MRASRCVRGSSARIGKNDQHPGRTATRRIRVTPAPTLCSYSSAAPGRARSGAPPTMRVCWRLCGGIGTWSSSTSAEPEAPTHYRATCTATAWPANSAISCLRRSSPGAAMRWPRMPRCHCTRPLSRWTIWTMSGRRSGTTGSTSNRPPTARVPPSCTCARTGRTSGRSCCAASRRRSSTSRCISPRMRRRHSIQRSRRARATGIATCPSRTFARSSRPSCAAG